MKAVIYHGPKTIMVEEVPKPELKQNEVLVKFKAGSLCGTDLHYYRGEWKAGKEGIILGHDASGVIVESGQRAALELLAFCDSCRFCLQGKHNLCEKGASYGYNKDGFFSELIAIPRKNLYPLPDNISYEEGAILEPVAMALHTFEVLQVKIGDWVTILGQGPIGLIMTQVAVMSGCRTIAVDLNDYRLKMAKRFGATICLNPKNEDITKEVRAITRGGSDKVIEVAGKKEAVEQTSKLVRSAGRVALVGFGNALGCVNFGNEVVYSNIAAYKLTDKIRALNLISQKVINVKDLISHRFPLIDFEKAAKTAIDYSKKPIKVVLHS